MSEPADLSPETLAASRNVIAMVTALHHDRDDVALELFDSLVGVERDNTLLLLTICAKQGYELAAEADGITLDEALVTCGLLSAGGAS